VEDGGQNEDRKVMFLLDLAFIWSTHPGVHEEGQRHVEEEAIDMDQATKRRDVILEVQQNQT